MTAIQQCQAIARFALVSKFNMLNFTEKQIKELNTFSNYLSYKETWIYRQFINTPTKILFLSYGNQGGKTSGVARSYVARILGIHPIAKKNVVYFECEDRQKAKLDEEFQKEYLIKHKSLDSATWNTAKKPQDGFCPECGKNIIQHKRNSRVFRFCSETLPGQSANVNKEGLSAEVKNTQYPELKKWLPQFLIKKDITARNAAIIIRDIHGGQDIIVEFVSYNQSVQSTAGPQRMGIWPYEQPPIDFLNEQYPRLIAEDGDMVITCTPADRMSHLYDNIFEKAKYYFRTKTIADKFKLKQFEKTDNNTDIAVFQAATEDNPTLSKNDIDALFNEIDDTDELLIRRYGIFKQISGRIFKSFDWSTHIISKERYFAEGIPHNWNHCRGIDYHEHVNWACGMIAISPQNEAFIYGEFNPSPENMVTIEIAREFAIMGKDHKYTLNLIDPLASKVQVNTGLSVIDDLNRAFLEYKREGIGTGGYWQPWDTKSTKGRDEIRKRLKNSTLVGKPFNNVILKNGVKDYLPTLWILDNCRITAKAFKNWRLEEWATTDGTKDMKETPQQKFSHFPVLYECLFKHPACKPKYNYDSIEPHKYHRFKGESLYASF